jgi:hypothetical protein
MSGKRLYEMTIAELRAEAERYEAAGNEMWATLCREQISLNYRIAEAFQRSCRSPLPQGGSDAPHG